MRRVPLALLLVGCAWGQISWDAGAASDEHYHGGTFTWPHTAAAGTHCAIVVFVFNAQAGSSNAATTVTYGATSLTEDVAARQNGSQTGTQIFIAALDTPSGASQTVTVNTANNTAGDMYGASRSYCGVNQTTPIDTQVALTEVIGTTLSGTLTSANAGEWYIGAMVTTAFHSCSGGFLNINGSGTTGTWGNRLCGTPSDSNNINVSVDTAGPVTGAQTHVFTANSSVPLGGIMIALVPDTLCAITTTTLPGGVIGAAYSQTVGTVNCTSPSFSISAGALPAGMTIGSSTGTISGMPSGSGGTLSFTVAVTGASQALSITITGGPPVISSVSVTGNSPSSLKMHWVTDVNSSSQVQCGTASGGPYTTFKTTVVCTGAGGSGVCISHAGDGVLTHDMVIGGLAENTTYWCQALSHAPGGSDVTSSVATASTNAGMVSTPIAVQVSEVSFYNGQCSGTYGMPATGRSANGDTVYWFWGANGLFADLGDSAGVVSTCPGAYPSPGPAGSHISFYSQTAGPMTGLLTLINDFTHGQANGAGCLADMQCWGHSGEANTGGWSDGGTWSPERGMSFKGYHVMPVMRIGTGGQYGYGSWITSADDGVTWQSPLDGNNQPISPHHMFQAYSGRCGAQLFIQHAQDYGGIGGQFAFTNYGDADSYVYFLCGNIPSTDGYLGRVRIEDLLTQDASKISYWTGGITPATATWTSDLNSAISTTPSQCHYLPSAEFVPDFNRYLLTCIDTANGPLIFEGPYAWGPWTGIGIAYRSNALLGPAGVAPYYFPNFPQPLAHTYKKLTSSPLTATMQLLAGGDSNGQQGNPVLNTYGPLWYTMTLAPRALASGSVPALRHNPAGLDLFYDFQPHAVSDWQSGSLPDRSPNAAYTATGLGVYPFYDKNGGLFLSAPTPYTKANTAFTIAIVFAHFPASLAIVANECVFDKGDVSLCRNGSTANSWIAKVGSTSLTFALATDVAAGGTTWPGVFIRWDGTNINVISPAGAYVPLTKLATGTYSSTLGTSALTLQSSIGGAQLFHGVLSELLVWNRALNDSEIAREAEVIRDDMGLRGLVLP